MMGLTPTPMAVSAVANAPAVHGRRGQLRLPRGGGVQQDICSQLMVKSVLLFVACANVAFAYGDANWNSFRDRHNLGKANGFEVGTRQQVINANKACPLSQVVIVLNLVLVVGALFHRQLLLGLWVLGYSFILLTCAVHTMIYRVFPWTPGVSYTATVTIMDNFKMEENTRPVVAVTICLIFYIVVFMIFVGKELGKLRTDGNGTRVTVRAVAAVPTASSRLAALLRSDFDLTLPSPPCASPPPSYSDLEEMDGSTLPPYSAAVKQQNLDVESGLAAVGSGTK
jgi:hypothetical protein